MRNKAFARNCTSAKVAVVCVGGVSRHFKPAFGCPFQPLFCVTYNYHLQLAYLSLMVRVYLYKVLSPWLLLHCVALLLQSGSFQLHWTAVELCHKSHPSPSPSNTQCSSWTQAWLVNTLAMTAQTHIVSGAQMCAPDCPPHILQTNSQRTQPFTNQCVEPTSSIPPFPVLTNSRCHLSSRGPCITISYRRIFTLYHLFLHLDMLLKY